MHLLALIFTGVVLLSYGCVFTPTTRTVMFNEDEFRPYAEKGTAIITGDAFLKTRGGEIRKGAGNTIYLMPVTAYTGEWIAHISMYSYLQIAPPDPQYFKYEKTTTADSDGRFEFTDLPAGQYYVATKIVWEVPSGGGGLSETGGWTSAKVQVALGEKKKVVVTGR